MPPSDVGRIGNQWGMAIVILIALYFVVKWAVKNGVKEAHRELAKENRQRDQSNREA